MKRWFVSDLHFAHAKVIDYCARPFKDVNEMNEAIVSDWNNKVSLEDEVYIMGDFSLNPKQAAIWVQRLNGYKHLVAGNHDACFQWKDRTMIRNANLIQKFLDMGFASVQMFGALTLSDGTEVLMSHLPYRDKFVESIDTRYLEYRPINNGTILLCGHLHCKYLKHGNMIDVGYENKLTLYQESEIIDIIKDERKFIPSRLTDFFKERENNEVD